MGWKRINIAKIVCTIQCDLWIQSHQDTNDIFHRTRKIKLKIHMESQKTENSQSIPEQKIKLGNIIILNLKNRTGL
jgi:hypothetical protein